MLYRTLLLVFSLFAVLVASLEVNLKSSTIETFNYKCFDNTGMTAAKNTYDIKYHIGLQVTDRASHQLLTRIFAMFLQKIFNYDNIFLIPLQNDDSMTAPNQTEWDKFYDTLQKLKNNTPLDLSNYVMINLEAWTPSARFGYLPDLVCEIGAPITPGRFGWFVPEALSKQNEKLSGPNYDIFMDQSNAEYKRYIFDSIPLEKLRNVEGAIEFISPKCYDRSCVTLLAEYRKDTAFIEEEIKKLNIYVNVLWLGANLKSTLDWLFNYYQNDTEAQQKSFVVLHWKPSHIIDSNIQFKQMILPKCDEAENIFGDTLCKYELTPILKYYFCNYLTNRNSPLILALRKFYIDEKNLQKLFLELNKQLGEKKNEITLNAIYNDVACKWLEENENTYKNWIPKIPKTKLIIGGIFPMKDKSRGHQNLSHAADHAVAVINKDTSILKNYELVLYKNDGQCKADIVMKTVIHYFDIGGNVLGVLGPACSETVEPIAGISKHMYMPVISYSAEGASFLDRQTYPYFFRTIGSNRQYEQVYISLMQHFGWKQIAAITEDGQKYTEYISHMEATMKQSKLQLIVNKKFLNDITPAEMNKHLKEIKERRGRIIIADIHYSIAEVALCEAYKLDMTAYHGYVWFFPSWLSKNWNLSNNKNNDLCSNEDIQKVLNGHFSIMHSSFGNRASKMQENITIENWLKEYSKKEKIISDYTGFAYDAVWTYAFAADKLIHENQDAIYNLRSNEVAKRFTELIWQTDFEGLSGRVRFGQGGSRITDLNIMQWHEHQFFEVGKYIPKIGGNGIDLYPKNGQLILDNNAIKWLSGQEPDDGTYDCSFSALAKLLSIDCDSSTVLFSVIMCLIAVIFISIVSFLFWKKRYDNKLRKSAKIMKNFGIDLLSPSKSKFYTLDKWEIPKENVVINRRLGEGAFGTVYGGEALLKPKGWTAVAVKTLKVGTSNQDRLDFLSEAEAMKRFDHRNIIKLLGVCLQSDPIYTIMEFMLYGDLKTYLLARRHMVNDKVTDDSDVSPKYLTMYAMDIARGLSYLAQQKYVHRDIACRNCLVDTRRVVKLGDFGMARPTYQSDYYVFHRKGMLPIRWMAPESLTLGKFTPASDVWAFGVAIYEIITFGSFPYQGLSDQHVMEDVKTGKTLKIPCGVKPHLEDLLKSCWNQDFKKRPSATEIVEVFLGHPRLLTPCLDNPSTSVEISETDTDEMELLPKPRKIFPITLDPNFDAFTQNTVASVKENTDHLAGHDNEMSENLYVPTEYFPQTTPNGYKVMSPLLNINENSDSSQAQLLKVTSENLQLRTFKKK